MRDATFKGKEVMYIKEVGEIALNDHDSHICKRTQKAKLEVCFYLQNKRSRLDTHTLFMSFNQKSSSTQKEMVEHNKVKDLVVDLFEE